MYNSSGHQLWNVTWGGSSTDIGKGVAAAGDGVYVTGETRSYGAGSQDAILIKYSLSTGSQQITLELNTGWNMVSLPITPDDPLASTVLSDAGYYQLVTWSGTGYLTATTFEAGRGYWLLVLQETNITLTGTPVETLNLTLSPGWSMIGGTTSNVQAADVFPAYHQLVTWTGTGYTPATTFDPAKGYWALVLAETQIQLPPT